MHKSKGTSRYSFDIINKFITTLYEHCKEDFTLYLFDNGSDEKYDVPNYPNIKYKYIEDQFKRGLVGPLNDGINAAVKDGCDVIIIVNDDIVFNKTINTFINTIQNHEYRDVGLYGPLTTGLLNDKSSQMGHKPLRGILEITNKPIPWGLLNGFLMAFTKEFVERFKLPDGNLCDTNYVWRGGEKALHKRIKENGGRVFVIRECWLYHQKLRGWVKLLRDRKRNESRNKTKNHIR
jgi:GT2 family glycosyltransferase